MTKTLMATYYKVEETYLDPNYRTLRSCKLTRASTNLERTIIKGFSFDVCKYSFFSPLQYPWMHHLSSIFHNNTLKNDEEIIVPALPYLQNMTRIIKETPKR